jgi:3-phenylpropionate/trans-cinnamate dioxygenase ferredoxin reductase subunit
MPTRFVLIGNGAAGTYCAEELRKGDASCEITLIDDEPYTCYNRVALPRYIKGVLLEQRVFVKDLAWHEKNRITLLSETKVVAVDLRGKTLTLHDGKELPYDRLLIATGGRPNKLQCRGADEAHHVYNFQYLDEARAIVNRIKESKVAVVMGGSFIGYELSEAFAFQKLETHWMMRGPWFLRRALDEAGGKTVNLLASDEHVQIHSDESVTEVIPQNGQMLVKTSQGNTIRADIVGVGLGLTMNIELFHDAGIETNVGILTNEFLETSAPEVWAAGDVAEFFDVVAQRHHRMGTWDNALNHGKHVAKNMLGAREPFIDVPVYASGMFKSNISVMGTTTEEEPELESVFHVDYDSRDYRRLFHKDSKIVGAILIGKMRGRKKVLELIAQRTSVDTPRSVLEMLAAPEPARPAAVRSESTE